MSPRTEVPVYFLPIISRAIKSDGETLCEALKDLERMHRISVTHLCWLSFCISQVAATSFPNADDDTKPRLVLIGDSTVKNGSGKGDSGLYGWGQVLNRHFDLARIEIENRALGGRSSRSYLTEGLWQKSLDRVRPGDFVLMQFGHNDGGQMFDGDRPRASIKGNSDEAIDGVVERTGEAETVHSFGWYLRRYIADTRSKGATPIVLSQIPRDRWEDGRVIRSDKDYGLWARQAAEQAGAFFIDLNEIVSKRYESVGADKVDRDYFTQEDWTHTTHEGAIVNAECVALGIEALENCELKQFLLSPNEPSEGRLGGDQEPAANFLSVDSFKTKLLGVTVQGSGKQRVTTQYELKMDSSGHSRVQMEIAEGNYLMSVRFGHAERATHTTVWSEARRLMGEPVRTAAGQYVERKCLVNVRHTQIGTDDRVRINDREKGPPLHPNWDQMLTIEFTGKQQGVDSISVEPASEITTVFIAGDSTVTDQKKGPYAGWGQMLPRFFGTQIVVANYAESGLALRSFEYQLRLKKILDVMRAGDYLLIQFGHNDQKDSREGAGPFTTYQQKLHEFVDAFREKGGNPILVSSMERLRMDRNGDQTPTLSEFAEAVRRVGKQADVPVIDLNRMSLGLYASLGPGKVEDAFVFYPAGTFEGQTETLKDRTHHNGYGAYLLARCVVNGIREVAPDLARTLSDDAGHFDPVKPELPSEFRRFDFADGVLAERPAGS